MQILRSSRPRGDAQASRISAMACSTVALGMMGSEKCEIDSLRSATLEADSGFILMPRSKLQDGNLPLSMLADS